jgi:triphosphoribosyl-dephospho-CoA synthetase
MDYELKSQGLNPGTSADLTVATVLAVFLECSLYA